LQNLNRIPVPERFGQDYLKIIKAGKSLSYKDDKVKIRIIVGNALETISLVKGKFDAVFFDPFSPKKCPELWSKDFFKQIRSKMRPNSVLATYSCATKVRRALHDAGFKVIDGPCIGRRSPSTIAFS